MDIPRFDQHRGKGADTDGIGETFQEFAYELLLFDYPGLHFFQGRGKDGAIDLAQTEAGSRLVVECKYVGTDGLAGARGRWRQEVARNLRTQLAEPEEASQHEAQYGPWYSTDPAITEYVFCVSSELGNQDQQDELRNEIAGFFAELSAQHTHLDHLSRLSVTVLDWNDLKTRLRKHPHILFRWFKLTRDYGLATLDEVADRTTFRSYLYSDKLPYHSRRQQLSFMPSPPGLHIPDEDGLLSLLEGDTLTGLVLTGSGGIGKTRLTLEIGHLAQSKGWVVLKVLRRLKEDALEHLARWVRPETKVLLLIDYVETQRDFDELMNELNDLNDSLGLHLRYVANCRTSYYKTIAAISRHTDVNLSPVLVEPAVGLWFESYLQQTVRHILEHSGIEVAEQHLNICRDIPVLAVFMSYLYGMGRAPELQSLLEEKSFARWIVKRLQLSFTDTPVFPNLAQMAALFPMPSAVAHHPDLKDHQVSFDRLAADGWIEKFPADDEYKTETWRAAHDVFADQILLYYFESIPTTVENFVRNLLSLARQVGCLRSALTTLQRLLDKPALKALNWPVILNSAIAEDPLAWRDVRDILIRTSLLTYPQIINLLGEHEEVWRGVEEATGFQFALGWLARRSLERTELDETQCSILESWLQKAAFHAIISNYALTSGIKFCPERVRESALNWIRMRPRDFQTHYLMVAWLEAELPVEEIAPAVEQWAAKFSNKFHLSFIACAWLKAGGNKEMIRIHITSWLDTYKTLAEASFVYKTWLNTGGDTQLIQEPLMAWFAEHKTEAGANFVYQAWLNAGGDTQLIHEPLMAWFAEHKTEVGASFASQAWFNAGGDTQLIHEPLMAWFAEHKTEVGASYVYKTWLNAGGDTQVIREPLMAWLLEHETEVGASYVYQAWLDAGGDTKLIESFIRSWLAEHKTLAEAQFIYKSWLDAGGDTKLIESFIRSWLAEHKTLAEASFVYKSWLDAGGDTELIREPLMSWLAIYKTDAQTDFIYKSWLDGGGEKELIRETLKDWLVKYGNLIEAHYVYKSWLDAGGERELIQEFLLAWLNEHGVSEKADFIFKAWLESGGSFYVIRIQAIQWLSRNYDKEVAVFLTKFLAKQADLPVGTVKNILNWCSKFSTNEDAFWRLTQLGRYLLNEKVAEEVWKASEAVLNQRLSSSTVLPTVVRGQITTLFSYLIDAQGLRAGNLRSGVDELLLRWLRHPASYGDNPRPHPYIERLNYVRRVADLIDSGALSVAADRAPLERFLQWVNNWRQSERRELLRPLLAQLESEHPAPGLWDIMKFEDDVPHGSDGSS